MPVDSIDTSISSMSYLELDSPNQDSTVDLTHNGPLKGGQAIDVRNTQYNRFMLRMGGKIVIEGSNSRCLVGRLAVPMSADARPNLTITNHTSIRRKR